MKMYEGMEVRYSSTIPELSTRWRSVVSFTPQPLYPRYPLDRRLVELHSMSGCCEEEKFLGYPNHSPLLYQLSYYHIKQFTVTFLSVFLKTEESTLLRSSIPIELTRQFLYI
jgi:hypothetical protein